MTKIEAIAHLELCIKHNGNFKKTLTDYIELCVVESIEESKTPITPKQQLKLAKTISNKALMLFDSDWWQAQALK